MSLRSSGFSALACLLALGVAAPAHAAQRELLCVVDDAAWAAHGNAPTNLAAACEGVEGVWFRADVAEHLLGAVREREALLQRMSLYEERLHLSSDFELRQHELIDLSVQREKTALGTVTALQKDLTAAQKELSRPWRQPAFLVSVGALLVVGALLAIRIP